ncbi:hypothetical protein BJ912DRAFT_921 [Pholiota molesta]|nr:hypothetical protein BJ912DRAFT_921 [Pholiota molesta]
MPLRVIYLPEYPKLVERNEVVNYIQAKMAQAGIDAEMLSKMRKTIDDLGNKPSPAEERQRTLQEDDVREHPMETIYQFLLGKFARFAILSHTWQSNEIVYRDTLPGAQPYQERPEYQKVDQFCRVALKDHGVSFAWIDTLCINKDSSSELDESIQSMYKWYQNSFICITHLPDTTSFENMHADNWFKRGWTLQELLAPKNMQFYYDHPWARLVTSNALNDKADRKIQEIILKATRIQANELISFNPLAGSDVATRMSWAASRKTTRGEDRAYSLMGIFGVNYSTSYGEGSERAFFRLIEAIIASRHTSHVIQVLNWGGDAISDIIHPSRLIPSRPECYLFKGSQAKAKSADSTTVNPVVEETQTEGIEPTLFVKETYIGDAEATAETSLFFPTLLEPMTLTHLGLRVRLLLIKVDVTAVHLHDDDSNRKSGPFDLTIKLGFPSATFETVEILHQKRFAERPSQISAIYDSVVPTDSQASTLFIGIYTFKEDDIADCVDIPFFSSAILLGIPTPFKNFQINSLSSKHFVPASKIDTRKPLTIRIHQNVSNNPADSTRQETHLILKKKELNDRKMTLLNVYL